MRIVKKKKGKEKYLYLQHSFRDGGKVITKERYLGKVIPANINKIKEEFSSEFKKELYKKLEKIRVNFQKEWRRVPKSAKERELKEISISFTYNSNAIEGSTITLEEVREILEDKIAPNKPIRDIKETESHNQVFLDMLKKKQKISEKLLLDWHKKIFEGTKGDIAGVYRDYLVRVGSYLAPDWQDVKKLMRNLILNIYTKKMNSVELAARLHYQFEKIHPFGDGNGRIGRLIMNHILWHSGYPMIIIEYSKRKSYYKALEKGEDLFANYFLIRYLRVHKKRLK